MAVLYTDGSGVSQNYVDALFWYSLAAAGGDAEAQSKAQALTNQGLVSEQDAFGVRRKLESWNNKTPPTVANGKFGPQAWNGGGGNRIREVQQVLSALGYDIGTPDGIAGAKTREAIKAFEASAAMPQTGRIDDRLIEVLNASLVEEQNAIA